MLLTEKHKAHTHPQIHNVCTSPSVESGNNCKLNSHSSKKPYILLILAHSWLPRNRKKFSSYFILYASKRQMDSRDCFPLST